MQDSEALVLEILKQEQSLAMSIFAQGEVTSTLKHYSRVLLSLPEVEKICAEIISVLNKVDFRESDLVNNLKKSGQFLWDHLFSRQIKERLKEAQNLNLVLSLDEELIHIPWELIYDGRDFLSLKFNLGRVVRTRSSPAPQYRFLQGPLRMLILANPTNDLKSAYLEGTFIKNQFDRKRKEINIDFKSTHIDTLYVKKNLRDYDLVHFAGHCEYDSEEPQDSGWVLADGRFTVQDIQTLGQTLSLPALIFSNACHSAQVREDPLEADYQKKTYGLASAFLFSGVRHYLGAIRRIEDPVSLVFAKEFYTQLISGRAVGESVRLARLKLTKEYGVGSLFWTSYLLYGDPNFVLFSPPPTSVSLPWPALNLCLSKKFKRRFALTLTLIVLGTYLYIYLPTLNPQTYALFSRSWCLFLDGKNSEVILLCEQVIKKDPAFLAVYPRLADAYQRLGKKEEALRYYFEYARQSEKRKDKKNLSAAYLGIGWIYQGQGEYEKAFDFYQKTLNLSQKNKDKLNEAVALRKLAVWYMDKEDYDKSLELLTKSSEINRQRHRDSAYQYNLACDYFDLGLVFANKDDFATAREFYQKSAQLFQGLKLKYELSDYYFNLGEIYLYDKQYQKALDFYLEGLKIDQRQQNLPSIVSDYNMLGELYVEMDDLEEAEKYFTQAIEAAKQIDAPQELAEAYYNLGLLYKQKNQKNKAREFLRLAQEIYQRIDTPTYQEIREELLSLSQ